MPDERSEWVSRDDLRHLIGIAELRGLLSRGRTRLVSRSLAEQTSKWPGFPRPLVCYPASGRPHVRLWLMEDLEPWLDRNRPGWRHLPPAPDD